MSSEQIFKKSVLGGFKKEGVLNYIEQLQSEIIELKKEITNKPDFSDEVQALKAKNEDASAETAALTAKYDALKAENDALSDKNAELLRELDDAKKIITEYEEKQHLFEKKISVIEDKFEQLASGYSVSVENKKSDLISEAKSDVMDANERIKTACNNFESSANALKSCVENLLSVISGISENLYSESDRKE